MRKICAMLIAKVLTEDQRQNHLLVFEVLLQSVKKGSQFLDSVITGEERWIMNTTPRQNGRVLNYIHQHPLNLNKIK